MSKREPVIGAEHHPEGTSQGWDFWWRSAAGDVVAVFHGFGGGGGGQVLAGWVDEAMTEPEGTSLEARARWPIERAHATALARVTPKGVAGGTMACVAIGEGRAAIAHVGDARVYAVTASGIERLTRDHTLSESRDPELEDLRAANPTLDFLLRCVGSEDRFAIEVTERACAPGEVLALCTPNVCKVLGDELGEWLARGLDAPAGVVRRVQSHEPRLPAALAMVFPLGVSAEAPRPERLEPDSVVVLYAPDERLERRRHPLGPAVTTVGRRGENDIVFDHASISRRHARFERRADGFWLVDESTNGTLVNGEPVREGRLRLHDRILIGKVLLVLSRSDIPFEIVEMEDKGAIDGLTGAHTRHYLHEQIGRELERARHAERPLSLVRLDITRFKQVNDTFGFPAGDEVLRAIARIARGHVRPGDVLARCPGDEFAVLLPGMDRDGAAAFAEGLRAELAVRAFDAAGAVIQGVAVWVGVAQASEETRDAEDLVRAAAPRRGR